MFISLSRVLRLELWFTSLRQLTYSVVIRDIAVRPTLSRLHLPRELLSLCSLDSPCVHWSTGLLQGGQIRTSHTPAGKVSPITRSFHLITRVYIDVRNRALRILYALNLYTPPANNSPILPSRTLSTFLDLVGVLRNTTPIKQLSHNAVNNATGSRPASTSKTAEPPPRLQGLGAPPSGRHSSSRLVSHGQLADEYELSVMGGIQRQYKDNSEESHSLEVLTHTLCEYPHFDKRDIIDLGVTISTTGRPSANLVL